MLQFGSGNQTLSFTKKLVCLGSILNMLVAEGFRMRGEYFLENPETTPRTDHISLDAVRASPQ